MSKLKKQLPKWVKLYPVTFDPSLPIEGLFFLYNENIVEVCGIKNYSNGDWIDWSVQVNDNGRIFSTHFDDLIPLTLAAQELVAECLQRIKKYYIELNNYCDNKPKYSLLQVANAIKRQLRLTENENY